MQMWLLMAFLACGGPKNLPKGMSAESAVSQMQKAQMPYAIQARFNVKLTGANVNGATLGALVMQKMGVSTQLLAPPDIYPALERGVIDATEFGMPTIDIKLGFYQVAKHNYYPGWQAEVDGEPTPIYRADHTFRAIRVPQGTSTVRFRYRPFSFYLGAILSLSTLLLLIGVGWRSRHF